MTVTVVLYILCLFCFCPFSYCNLLSISLPVYAYHLLVSLLHCFHCHERPTSPNEYNYLVTSSLSHVLTTQRSLSSFGACTLRRSAATLYFVWRVHDTICPCADARVNAPKAVSESPGLWHAPFTPNSGFKIVVFLHSVQQK